MPSAAHPNVWSAGGLFAFSGLDGPTDYYRPLVASLLDDRVGLRFHTDPPAEARWPIALADLDGDRCLVGGDVLELYRRGERRPALTLAFLDRDTLVGGGDGPALGPAAPVRTFVAPPGGAIATAMRDGRFCIAFAGTTAEAELRAEAGLEIDPRAVVEGRKGFFARLPGLSGAAPGTRAAYGKAWSILKCNTYSPQGTLSGFWTTPDRWPHRYMWLWDSAFHALAWRRFDGDMGAQAVSAMLEQQAEDGFVPYMTGPDGVEPTTFTQPPVLAWAAWKVYASSRDRQWLAWAYPRLGRYVIWDAENRDRDRDGLLEWAREQGEVGHCGESGMDNSPRFDAPAGPAAVDFNAMLAAEYEALGRMARTLGRDEEAATWLERYRQLRARIEERLWSEEHGLYLDRGAEGFIAVPTVAGFHPLYAGVPSEARAARMVVELQRPESFWRPLPVPSVAADHPAYSDDCWRGPVWLNTSYLTIEGLLRYGYEEQARHIAERTVAEVCRWYEQGGCIYEYYDAEGERAPWALSRKGNRGVGTIRDYGWSAAIFIELVHFLTGEPVVG